MKRLAVLMSLVLFATLAVAQTLAPVESAGVPLYLVFVAAAAALVVGGVVGHQMGKNPAAAAAAFDAFRAKAMADLHGLISSSHQIAIAAQANVAALVAKVEPKPAPAAELPVPATEPAPPPIPPTAAEIAAAMAVLSQHVAASQPAKEQTL